MKKNILVVAEEFSKTPGPRYEWEGDYCGEKFREQNLLPRIREAIKSNQKLIVDLDGTAGFGTSFLEEAFGGLVRNNELNANEILSILEIKSEEEEFWIERIKEYIMNA